MKKSAWILAALLIVGVGYLIAAPYVAAARIETGIVERDPVLLDAHIDFPVLRQNLKEQLNALLIQRAAAELEDNPLGALAVGLTTTLVEGLLEQFVTPAGLANLMASQDRDPEPQDAGTAPATGAPAAQQAAAAERKSPFKNARHAYDDLETFSIWVRNDDGAELRFVMKRYGLSWKLTNILLPAEALATSG